MTHEERIHYHTYVTCETPAEHAERIVALEELAQDMYAAFQRVFPEGRRLDFEQRAEALGLELGS